MRQPRLAIALSPVATMHRPWSRSSSARASTCRRAAPCPSRARGQGEAHVRPALGAVHDDAALDLRTTLAAARCPRNPLDDDRPDLQAAPLRQPNVSFSQPPRMSVALCGDEDRARHHAGRRPRRSRTDLGLGQRRPAPRRARRARPPRRTISESVSSLLLRRRNPLLADGTARPAPAHSYRSTRHDDHRAHEAGHPVPPGRCEARGGGLLLPRPDRLAERRPDRAGRPRRLQLRLLRERLRRPDDRRRLPSSAPT